MISEKDFNDDPRIECSRGISLGTWEWVSHNYNKQTQKILIVEFTSADIVAIPIQGGGKFRVKKCRVLRQITQKEIKKYNAQVK